MKLTKQKALAVRKVINNHRLIMDRVKELKKRGYELKMCSIKYGSSPVGKVHQYTHTCRLQVGSPRGYLRYSWMVIFDPLSFEKIKELNDIYFHKEAV